MMLKSIRYQNFRVLADATLKLSPFTLIVGPNGSGKSTALRAFSAIQSSVQPAHVAVGFDALASIDVRQDPTSVVQLVFESEDDGSVSRNWFRDAVKQRQYVESLRGSTPAERPWQAVMSARSFFLDSDAIAEATQVKPISTLASNGGGLAGVLQDLRDQHPERFEDLVSELRRWLPDFDHLLFQTPREGFKSVSLRTKIGRHAVPAADLSQGTLFALALLTIAYLPNPPALIGIEEPDRGIHPRLLREVRDALYRLAYPESCGVDRHPVQVIATTHSPYLVDLFKDHPEEVVLAQKEGLHATLTRLVDQPHWEEIVSDAQLGELWYSGVLGGVPVGT